MIALAACLVLATALLLTRLYVDDAPPTIAKQPVPAVAPVPNSVSPNAGTPDISKQGPTSQAGRQKPRPTATSASVKENGFMALGAYDPAMMPGDVQVVRLELTGADLRLVGAPVAEDLSDRRLLADIVVGNDGTPYAVRLVR
jgi:hypothetical protein